jgi:membrane protein
MGIWSLLAATFNDWYDDRAQRMGAALAYYTVFALSPGVVLIVAVAGLGFGTDTAQRQFVEQIGYLLGAEGASAIEAMIVSARRQAVGSTAAVLAAGTLLFGLWGVFGELQDALNTIWGVAPKPGRSFLNMVKDRFLSFAMVTGIGFLLLVSLAVSAWLAAAGQFFSYLLPAPEAVLKAMDVSVSFAVITVLFALTFKLLPDVDVAWRDVWLGAAVTSLLFVAGKSLIGLYLGKSSIGSVYGAAGSLVVILVWVYYSSQIVIFGAEFTKVWARRHGAGAVVEPTAVPLTREAKREQGIGRRDVV